MHGIFLGQIPGFPGEWEPCINQRLGQYLVFAGMLSVTVTVRDTSLHVV